MEHSTNGNAREPALEFLRFIFCILIINYHFYSHFLKDIEFPNFFCRGYLGDEFFFIIAGFFFAKTALTSEGNSVFWSIRFLSQRLKKLALLYYVTWLLCFIGRQIRAYYLNGSVRIINDFLNSFYELFFLEMFGFRKGLYCNVVSWFFSAYLICFFIIGPWMAKYKMKYAIYVAPLIMFFSYGALSVLYDYMYAPDYIIPNTVIHKGIIRAMAGINAGIFSYGIASVSHKWIKKPDIMRIMGVLICMIVVLYMIYPFESNVVEATIQFDYIFTFLLFIGMSLVFVSSSYNKIDEEKSKIDRIAYKLGKYSFYAFFGQAIFYSMDELVYRSSLNIPQKWIILNVAVFLSTILLVYMKKLCVFEVKQIRR